MATFSVELPGLQGLARRRARRARAAARRRAHGARRRLPTSPSSTPAASRTRRCAKSRKAASRAARTHGRVYVTGCGANLSRRRLRRAAGERRRRAAAERGDARVVAGDVGAIGCVQADARLDRVRAFVKVQDGCSFSCAFCVIPLVRGGSRSRRAEAVLDEIRRRVAQGHREVVLTGVNLGCFRDRDAGYDLPRLVREAGEVPGPRAAAALLDRGQPPDARRWSRRCARRRPSRRTCTSRSSPATTPSCARWPAATRGGSISRGSSRSRTST